MADIVDEVKGEATTTSTDAEKVFYTTLQEVLKTTEGKSQSQVYSLIMDEWVKGAFISHKHCLLKHIVYQYFCHYYFIIPVSVKGTQNPCI